MLLAILAVSWLFWLLLAYVPVQLEVFATFGISLTGPARLVVTAANMFVRLLVPVVVLGVTVVGFLGGFRLLSNRVRNRSAAKLFFNGAIMLALGAIVASAFIVWGMHTAYAEAARQLDAYRAEHPLEEP